MSGKIVVPGLPERYEPSRVLGQGGMGMVLLAWDRELERDVAVKLVKFQHEGLARRMGREARTMASIEHPNLCRVHDFDVEGAVPYVVMEFLEGKSLKGARLEDPLKVLLEAGKGIAALHAARILHRDVKPDNILRTNDGRVVVVDLGLARGAGDATLTATGAVMGTPRYMAPELFLGDEQSSASDWYSWGVSLYELCEQDLPFSDQQIMAVAAGGPLPDLVFDRLDPFSRQAELIRRCMDPEPEERPRSLAAIRRLLEEVDPSGRREATAPRSAPGTSTARRPPAGGESKPGAEATQALPRSAPSPAPAAPTPPAPDRRPLLFGILAGVGVAVGVALTGLGGEPAGRGPAAPPTGTRPPPTEVWPAALPRDLAKELGAELDAALDQRDLAARYEAQGTGAYADQPLLLRAAEWAVGAPSGSTSTEILSALEAHDRAFSDLGMVGPFEWLEVAPLEEPLPEIPPIVVAQLKRTGLPWEEVVLPLGGWDGATLAALRDVLLALRALEDRLEGRAAPLPPRLRRAPAAFIKRGDATAALHVFSRVEGARTDIDELLAIGRRATRRLLVAGGRALTAGPEDFLRTRVYVAFLGWPRPFLHGSMLDAPPELLPLPTGRGYPASWYRAAAIENFSEVRRRADRPARPDLYEEERAMWRETMRGLMASGPAPGTNPARMALHSWVLLLKTYQRAGDAHGLLAEFEAPPPNYPSESYPKLSGQIDAMVEWARRENGS
jgi:hypothetical protein